MREPDHADGDVFYVEGRRRWQPDGAIRAEQRKAESLRVIEQMSNPPVEFMVASDGDVWRELGEGHETTDSVGLCRERSALGEVAGVDPGAAITGSQFVDGAPEGRGAWELSVACRPWLDRREEVVGGDDCDFRRRHWVTAARLDVATSFRARGRSRIAR